MVFPVALPCFVSAGVTSIASSTPFLKPSKCLIPSSPIHHCSFLGSKAQPKPRQSLQRTLNGPVHRSTRTPVLAKSDESSTSLPIRIVSILLVIGVTVGGILPFAGVFQRNGQIERTLDAQLSRVPVFTVTDSTGRPYMTETDDHRLRLGYFFIQPTDAEQFLEKVRGESPDSKVLAVGLDKAVTFLGTRSGLKSTAERFDIFPDKHEAELARQLTEGKFQQTFGESAVPIFYIDGLAVKSNNSEGASYPLFFEKAKLDEALANLKKADPTANLSADNMEIIDLKQTIREIRAGSNARLNQVAFVPISGSLEKLRALNKEP